MSLISRRTRILLAALVALGSLGALLPLLAAKSMEPREIVILARQMSFYFEGGTAGNPTIRVSPGERIRVTLVNGDAGIDHDFAVPAWSVATAVRQGVGKASVVFQAPGKPGKTAYVCTLHDSMMTGTIEVVAAGQ
jgi:plastocyanin